MDWHFAKSMPQIPHFYARRKEWPDKKQFEELVVFLRENSVEEKFFSKTFQYFYLNDYQLNILNFHYKPKLYLQE